MSAQLGTQVTVHLLDPRLRLKDIGSRGSTAPHCAATYPTMDNRAFYACHACAREAGIPPEFVPQNAQPSWWARPALFLPEADYWWFEDWMIAHRYTRMYDIPQVAARLLVLTDSLTEPTVEREVPLLVPT